MSNAGHEEGFLRPALTSVVASIESRIDWFAPVDHQFGIDYSVS